VHKFLIFFGLLIAMTLRVFASETYTLADGSSVSGDIVKFDDHDAMIHTTADAYTNIDWPKFSQDSLKQLSANPKYRAYAAPFLDAVAPSKPSVAVNEPTRMTSPGQLHPSIIGGMFGSSLGLFILLVIYTANLYAAFEVAVVRGRPPALVIGVSAVLPIAGPIIFLSQPVKSEPQEEPAPGEPMPGEPVPPAPGTPPAPGQEDLQIVSASWQGSQEEKKPQPQVFSRGKFTLNKRFIETKFAGFVGEPKGEAKTYSMSVKTLKETITVECIKQVGQTEAIVETPHGQLTVAFGDIQEIILTPKPA
jgi:hypothetical protein